MGLFLNADKNDMERNWFYRIEGKIKLLPFNGQTESGEKSFMMNEFCVESPSWEIHENPINFLDYKDPRYAIVLVELKVNEPEPQWQITDHEMPEGDSLMKCTICNKCFPSGKTAGIKGGNFCSTLFGKICGKATNGSKLQHSNE